MHRVTPECQLFFEDGDSLETLHNNCVKNPGHINFIPVSDFTMDHLPRDHRTKRNMESILSWCDLTLKITIRFISKNRPDTYADSDNPYPYSTRKGNRRIRRCGTGYISSVTAVEDSIKGIICPCHVCKKSDQAETEFWPIVVNTATHVIYDDSEAAASTFDCFYDSEDKIGMCTLYGHSMFDTDSNIDRFSGDLCEVVCITHDKELVEKLLNIAQNHMRTVIPEFKNSLGIIISHPHGCCKRITVGRVLHLTVPVGGTYPRDEPISFTEGTIMICRLPLYPWTKDNGDRDGIATSTDENEETVLTRDNDTTIIVSENQELGHDNETSHKDDPECVANIDDKNVLSATNYDSFSPKPGSEFSLPRGLTFTLSSVTDYALQFTSLDSSWFTLPPDTKFTSPDGSDLCLPPEAEFFTDGISLQSSYVTYIIDSCPGSSGAGVLQDGGDTLFNVFPHSGSLTQEINRSGLQPYSISSRWSSLSLPCSSNFITTGNIWSRFMQD